MAFAAVLARIHPKLREWFLFRGLHPTDLTEFFPTEGLESGAAVMDLAEELGVEVEESEIFEHAFWDLIAACAQESRRQHSRLATMPLWEMHLGAEAKRRRRWREEEQAKFDADDERKGRQVPPPPPSNPRFATARRRGAALDGDSRAREKAEDAERAKWLGRLQGILDTLEGTLRRESGCADDRRLIKALVGGRRASTLRARVRTWERYRQWLRGARGLEHPRSAGDFVDYLLDRAQEPCGRSVLRGAYDMLRFAEEMVGTPNADRISEMPLVKASLKGLIAEAAAIGPNRRGGAGPATFRGHHRNA